MSLFRFTGPRQAYNQNLKLKGNFKSNQARATNVSLASGSRYRIRELAAINLPVMTPIRSRRDHYPSTARTVAHLHFLRDNVFFNGKHQFTKEIIQGEGKKILLAYVWRQ